MAQCFAIFEGGGAKGLAHVGALKAAEEQHLEFLGVAGASAGAIIAALVAAGYNADEVYCPNPGSGVSPLFAETNWIDLLGASEWDQFKRFRDDIARIPPTRGSPGLGTAWRAKKFYKKWSTQLESVAQQKGFFSSQDFEKWLNRLLGEKLGQVGREVTFENLHNAPNTIPLKVVSVDIKTQELVTYSHENTPKLSVARAVAASISIPIFFRPTMVENKPMVDGGLMSNFPAWLFEIERAEYPPYVHIYGFTLVEAEPQIIEQENLLKSLMDYTATVARTGVFGGQTLVNAAIESLQVVPIKTSFGVLDFELSDDQKVALYNEGLNSATRYFHDHAVADDVKVTIALKRFSQELSQIIPVTPIRVRSNVILPIGRDEVTHLRVTYSHNMDNETDDRLRMPVDQSGAGEAFRLKQPIVTDFRQLRQSGTIKGLNKYDTALVWDNLISLISVPIFKAERDWEKPPKLRPQPMAILSFDCDKDILNLLATDAVTGCITKHSILMGRLLQGKL